MQCKRMAEPVEADPVREQGNSTASGDWHGGRINQKRIVALAVVAMMMAMMMMVMRQTLCALKCPYYWPSLALPLRDRICHLL